jgi:hypothetical protein
VRVTKPLVGLVVLKDNGMVGKLDEDDRFGGQMTCSTTIESVTIRPWIHQGVDWTYFVSPNCFICKIHFPLFHNLFYTSFHFLDSST